jgi:endonuclease YncB( thermonuclease family)
MRNIISFCLIIFLFIGLSLHSKEPETITLKEAIVKEVIDGDTLKIITAENKQISVRLSGIETAESNIDSKKIKKQATKCKVDKLQIYNIGLEAKMYVTKHIKYGDSIMYLDFGEGYFGRPLIWILRINEEVSLINKNIIGLGYGQVYRGALIPNDLKKELYDLEKQARKDKIGIWKILPKPCL